MNQEREILLAEVRSRLERDFSPTDLKIINRPHNHPELDHGAAHLTIRITASCLAKCKRVEAHRLVYGSLNDMIPSKIHSLSVSIIPV